MTKIRLSCDLNHRSSNYLNLQKSEQNYGLGEKLSYTPIECWIHVIFSTIDASGK
jgi:hypothetical protein